MTPLSDKYMVIIDTETTDKEEYKLGEMPEIISVSGIKIDKYLTVVEEFHALVCPTDLNKVTDQTTRLTGLTREKLSQCKGWHDTWRQFAKFTSFANYKLLGWYVGFDVGVLRQEYALHTLGYPHCPVAIDIMSMWYSYCLDKIRMNSWGLRAAYQRLTGLKANLIHTSLDDCKMALIVLKVILGAGEEKASEFGGLIEVG